MRRVFAWLTAVDACWFYRIKLPLEELARSEGWDVAWGEPGPDIHDYDVVIALHNIFLVTLLCDLSRILWFL